MFTAPDPIDRENPVVLTQPVFEKFRSMGFTERRNGAWWLGDSQVIICNSPVRESKKPPLWQRLLVWLFV